MSGPVVVCGARGFVGSNLVDRLVANGRTVRAGTRSPDSARRARPDLDWVALDVESPKTLDAAFEGADAVVYLVHQMRADSPDLEALEKASARNALEAAERAGVRRIVYLGAPSGNRSPHLNARLATGEILRGGSVSTVELRAGMVVGVGSESWWIVRDLAMRLPVMVLPSWLKSRSQPIGLDDVVAALECALDLPEDHAGWYDLPGPETLSAREILDRVAAVRGMRPVMVPIPILTPDLSSHWIRLITRADTTIARKLVHGLTGDLVAPDDGFWAVCPHLERTPIDVAIARALESEDPSEIPRFWRGMERVVRTVARRAR